MKCKNCGTECGTQDYCLSCELEMKNSPKKEITSVFSNPAPQADTAPPEPAAPAAAAAQAVSQTTTQTAWSGATVQRPAGKGNAAKKAEEKYGVEKASTMRVVAIILAGLVLLGGIILTAQGLGPIPIIVAAVMAAITFYILNILVQTFENTAKIGVFLESKESRDQENK